MPSLEPTRVFRLLARLRLLAGTAALALCLAASPALAQPDPNQRIGQTVADAASPHYRFERFVVADGERRWRIHLAIPRQRAGRDGYAALYMLDGNAALMEFDAPLLDRLARGRAPVLAFVGYDNELRIDGAARTRDYTPSAVDDGLGQGPRGGGAAAFAAALAERIQPEVRRRARIDRSREALWGHSLGGLFVLDLLYTRADAFAQWFPASPSLWWDNGRELGAPERQFLQGELRRPAGVAIMQGGSERAPNRGPGDAARSDDPRVAAHRARIAAVPADAAQQLAQRLQAKPGLRACYREFAGLGHGPMLRASVRAAALAMAGDPARACADAQGPSSRDSSSRDPAREASESARAATSPVEH
ncbi:esterase [Lysobacter enzymogenes]|uniref:Esterase n=1 Tax=Lysobacter enzymogenes TaxID=69 RepID=A0A0S2DGS1_LYSEN|nr:alpha/beta hydrolase-fold protein [Lysobacter enzymogenes]ALN57771.1 esterase [Lysobacter enzymogenes]